MVPEYGTYDKAAMIAGVCNHVCEVICRATFVSSKSQGDVTGSVSTIVATPTRRRRSLRWDDDTQ